MDPDQGLSPTNVISAWIKQIGQYAGNIPDIPVNLFEYNLAPEFPGEYARLYIIVTVIPNDFSIILEHMVLVVGPSNACRVTSGVFRPQYLAIQIYNILRSLDGSLKPRKCLFKRPGLKIDGVLDSVVFTSFVPRDSRKDASAAESLFMARPENRQRPGLELLFKYDSEEAKRKPRTQVWLDLHRDNPSFGHQYITIGQRREEVDATTIVPYLTYKRDGGSATNDFAVLMNTSEGGAGYKSIGWNLFNNSSDQQRLLKWEYFTKDMLIKEGQDGLNAATRAGWPRLYLVDCEGGLSTMLIFNQVTNQQSRVSLHLYCDPQDRRSMDAEIGFWPFSHILSLFDRLETVVLHWGQAPLDVEWAEGIVRRLAQDVDKPRRFANQVLVRLEPLLGNILNDSQARFSPLCLFLTTLLRSWHPKCVFSSSFVPNVIANTQAWKMVLEDSQSYAFLLLSSEIKGMMMNQNEECFDENTMPHIAELCVKWGIDLERTSGADVIELYTVRLWADPGSQTKEQRKQALNNWQYFLMDTASACVKWWRDAVEAGRAPGPDSPIQGSNMSVGVIYSTLPNVPTSFEGSITFMGSLKKTLKDQVTQRQSQNQAFTVAGFPVSSARTTSKATLVGDGTTTVDNTQSSNSDVSFIASSVGEYSATSRAVAGTITEDIIPSPYKSFLPVLPDGQTEPLELLPNSILVGSTRPRPRTPMPPPTNQKVLRPPSSIKSTALSFKGLGIFARRLEKPLNMKDREDDGPILPEGNVSWYKLLKTPGLLNNAYFSYLKSIFSKNPNNSAIFVEVDSTEKTRDGTVLWTKLGVEFPIGSSKQAFSNTSKAHERQFGRTDLTASFPVSGYYAKEGALVLARDCAADDSKFGTVRAAGKNTNTDVRFTELSTFLKITPPLWMSIFVSGNVLLNVDEGDGRVFPRNALWLWPAEAQRVEMRLAFKISDTKGSSSLFEDLITLFAPGFDKINAANVRIVARKTWLLGTDGVSVKETASLDLVFPVILTTGEVKRSFKLILSLSGDMTTVRVQTLADGSLEAILGWLPRLLTGGNSDDEGVPSYGSLKDQSGQLFSSGSAKDPKSTIDLRQLVFTVTDVTSANGSQSHQLTAFQLDLEAMGKIGTDPQKVSALLRFKWDKGKRSAFIGSLWNERGSTKATTIPQEVQFEHEPFKILKNTTGTRTTFKLGELITDVEMPAFLPTELQSFYLELATDGVYLSASTGVPPRDTTAKAPMLELSKLRMSSSISWTGNQRSIAFGFSGDVTMRTRDPLQFPPAALNVTINYAKTSQSGSGNNNTGGSSQSSWSISGSARGLRMAHLVSLFAESSEGDAVMDFMEPVVLEQMTIEYKVEGKAPSSFTLTGDIIIGKLRCALSFVAGGGSFTIRASATPDAKQVQKTKLSQILEDCYAGAGDFMPKFISDMDVDPSKDFGLELEVVKAPKATIEKPKPEQFVVFNMTINLPQMTISLMQHQGPKPATGPAEITRIVRVAFKGFPVAPKLPVIGDVAPAFEQLEFVWTNNDITQKLQDDLNSTVYEKASEKLLTKALPEKPPTAEETKPMTPVPAKIVLRKGCHILVIGKPKGALAVILDYAFASGKTSPPAKNLARSQQQQQQSLAQEPPKNPQELQNGELATAPLKQDRGPLTISNISFGVNTNDSSITVKLDATFQFGPVSFSLLNLTITVSNIGAWDPATLGISGDIDGMALAYAQPPVTLAGMFRRSKPGAYDGGLALAIPPYSLLAVGAYQSEPFRSLFVLAVLKGPLAQFAIGEISGVTAGFGYNSMLKMPTPSEVSTHPFLANPAAGDGAALMATMSKGSNVWFPRDDGSNWIAAGLTVKALQTLSVTAVLAVEFGPAVQISVFAEANAQAPAPVAGKAIRPFVNAKLGIIGILNITKGTFSIAGELAPSSFILDPSCRLVGGFALAYWFAGSGYNGDWVFTVGGYHPAYSKPAHYPSVSSPVGISWSFGSGEIQIRGGAYFAVTPQVLMGGGRLSAIVTKDDIFGTGSDVYVNFQAWADFLINFQPFRYVGDVGASIFLKIKANFFIASKTFTFNPVATLHAEGPTFSGTLVIKDVPIIGRVTVDFGTKNTDPVPALIWSEFLDVVFQSTDWRNAKDKDGKPIPPKAHIISLAEGNTDGVMDDKVSKTSNEDDPLVVRTGPFTLNVQSMLPIKTHVVTGGTSKDVMVAVYFKPMQTTTTVESVMTVTISGTNLPGDTSFVVAAPSTKVPSGVWGKYDKDKDPSKNATGSRSLLKPQADALIDSVMSLSISTPPPDKDGKTPGRWTSIAVNIDKTAQVFDPNAPHPVLPEHQPSSILHSPSALKATAQAAIADLKDVWASPSIDPKGAIDCWTALFHPPPTAIEPMPLESNAPSQSDEQSPTLSALPPAYDPLPGTLPTQVTANPAEYYADLPRVSQAMHPGLMDETLLTGVAWYDENGVRQARCYVQRGDGRLVERKRGDDGVFRESGTRLEPLVLNPGGKVASLHFRVQDPKTLVWGDMIYLILEHGGMLHMMHKPAGTENWTRLFLPPTLSLLLEGSPIAATAGPVAPTLTAEPKGHIYFLDGKVFPDGTHAIVSLSFTPGSDTSTWIRDSILPSNAVARALPGSPLAALRNSNAWVAGGTPSILLLFAGQTDDGEAASRTLRLDCGTISTGWAVMGNWHGLEASWATGLTRAGLAEVRIAAAVADALGKRAVLYVERGRSEGAMVLRHLFHEGWKDWFNGPVKGVAAIGRPGEAKLVRLLGIVGLTGTGQREYQGGASTFFQIDDGGITNFAWTWLEDRGYSEVFDAAIVV